MKIFRLIVALFLCIFSLSSAKAWACTSGFYESLISPGKIVWAGKGDSVSASATDAIVYHTAWMQQKDGSIKYQSYNTTIKYRVVFVRLEKPDSQDTKTWKWHAKFTATATSVGFAVIPRSRDVTISSAESAAYFSGITDDGCPPQNVATVPDLEDYHSYLDTPTPPPTPKATATPTPTPGPLRLSVLSSNYDICAGGWDQSYNNGAGGYYYLSKETGNWVPRDAQHDPHIAGLSAQVMGGSGNYAGMSVQFQWTMPGGPNGSGLVETRSASVNARGVATVKVVSGDQLSRDVDDKGNVLFSGPVVVHASCTQGSQTASQSVSLNVLAPSIQWQIKDAKGKYVSWNGDTWDNYYNSDKSHDVPLRALLTFNNVPVFGHHVSWGFDKILDNAQVEVTPDNPDYPTYGHMSGAISTTPADGGATATYTLGYNFGQIIYDIEDASIYVPNPSSALTAITTPGRVSSAATQPLGPKRIFRRFYPGLYTGVYRFVHDTPYNDIDGRPNSVRKEAYPAPSGAEDPELLPATLLEIQSILSQVTHVPANDPKSPGGESKTGWRLQDFLGQSGETAFHQRGQ